VDLERIQVELADVDRALERLDDGSYGACEVCRQPVDDGVLERAPATRLCPTHQVPVPGPAAVAEPDLPGQI
jgi:DnaK suppressor protein